MYGSSPGTVLSQCMRGRDTCQRVKTHDRARHISLLRSYAGRHCTLYACNRLYGYGHYVSVHQGGLYAAAQTSSNPCRWKAVLIRFCGLTRQSRSAKKSACLLLQQKHCENNPPTHE